MTDTADTSKSNRDVPSTARALTAQAQAAIAREREEARQQVDQSLDREAIAAIEETQRAIDAINANTISEALAALERASGKVNVLLARNPATALIPARHEVVVFDTAPEDPDTIVDITDAADAAMLLDDYPAARALLYRLMSELRVRTYNLPLATYPAAVMEAARLLGEKKKDEARLVLTMALSTLVIIDQVTPLPLLVAREAIQEAQARSDKDKEAAMTFLETARYELDRAILLGYAAQDPEYNSLKDEISNLEKQLKKGGDATSLLANLRERLSRLLKRTSDGKPASQGTSQSGQTDQEKRAA